MNESEYTPGSLSSQQQAMYEWQKYSMKGSYSIQHSAEIESLKRKLDAAEHNYNNIRIVLCGVMTMLEELSVAHYFPCCKTEFFTHKDYEKRLASMLKFEKTGVDRYTVEFVPHHEFQPEEQHQQNITRKLAPHES